MGNIWKNQNIIKIILIIKKNLNYPLAIIQRFYY